MSHSHAILECDTYRASSSGVDPEIRPSLTCPLWFSTFLVRLEADGEMFNWRMRERQINMGSIGGGRASSQLL